VAVVAAEDQRGDDRNRDGEGGDAGDPPERRASTPASN
jgi:hypothetical protein